MKNNKGSLLRFNSLNQLNKRKSKSITQMTINIAIYKTNQSYWHND